MRPPPPVLSLPGYHHIDAGMFAETSAEPARRRLLLAGLSLFADQGYTKTSIRQIAVEAGTNVAAISYYFGGKAGLYQAIFWGGSVPPVDTSTAPEPFELSSLDELFECFLDPLRSGKPARAWMKLQRREMLEPTGLWQQKVDRGFMPMHIALVAYLQRRLGLARVDDEVRALALLVIGPAVNLLVNCETVDRLAPHLLDGPGAVDAWRERLSRSAEAVIAAERERRRSAAPVEPAAKAIKTARVVHASAPSHRTPRSKA